MASKLLFVTRVLNGRGGQIVLSSLVKELQGQGADLHFVAFKPKGTDDFPGCSHLYQGLKNVEIIEIDTYDNDAAMMNAYVDASTAYLRKHQHAYDKIVLDSWFTAMAGILAQLDYRKTYHLVQSDPYFIPENQSVIWKSRAFELLPYFPMQRIVVSRSIQQLFQERYGQRYPAINLFIDNVYRQTNYTVVERPVLRFVTSASDFNIPSKGLDFLLDSLQQLSGDEFSLTILSGKPIVRDLSGYTFPIAVASAQGPEQMASALQAHDVYINTSTNETFCLALAEAVTLGMPAIALDSVGNRDYVRDHNFIFVKNNADFVTQLEHIRDLGVRKLLHKAARASMRRYSLGTTVEQFKQAIDY